MNREPNRNRPQPKRALSGRGGDKPGKRNQPRPGVVPDTQAPFLNPYTFVPTPPRENLREPFNDSRPLGHERLHEGGWTGSIKVRLTVRTPLLLLDAANAFSSQTGDKEHLVYPVLTRDGSPYLPATSVKGMLRSAYEIITNSRFGVFDAGQKPLGWRRVVKDALSMQAVRISDDGKEIEFCQAVRLPRYPPVKPKKYPDESWPEHGDEVWVQVQSSGTTATVSEIKRASENPGEGAWERGYVFVSGNNAVKKKHERVFIKDKHRKPVPLTDELRKRWDELMDNYRDAHTPEELKGRNPIAKDGAKQLDWSRHLKGSKAPKLQSGTLCYARLRGEQITALYPVTVSRDISELTPAQMLSETLHPAPEFSSLSPADRLFGWVAPKGSGVRPASYRGRLRVGPVRCESTEPRTTPFTGDGLPLAILSAPKPSQGRFYLSQGEDQNPLPDGLAKKDLYLSERNRLRGRKVYWHHAGITDEATYWSDPETEADPTQQPIGGRYREFRRPRSPQGKDSQRPRLTEDRRVFATGGKNEEQRDKQNRSILGWVNQGTEFTFTLDVRDIDDIELGALAWLLSLEEGHYHRLGLGKPLGFGSVRLTLEEEGTFLYNDEEWATYYRSLSTPLPPCDLSKSLNEARTRFEETIRGTPLEAVRKIFLTTTAGRADLPVHYPRVRPQDMAPGPSMPPDPRGRSYEWFTANEKTAGNSVARGHGRSLPTTEDHQNLVLYKETLRDPQQRHPGSR